MTTVSSIDQIFRNIGNEIEKFPVNHMTFPTYHEFLLLFHSIHYCQS